MDLLVQNLSKSFGKKKVLDAISFTVSQGEFCILLGPSGCGKSTMLRLIAGLEHQDEGQILIGGSDVSELSPGDRDVSMVFQSYALYPHMTTYDNIAFPLRIRKMPKDQIDQKVRDAARMLSIEECLDRRPAGLSGGQRQRVALGRAIVRKPKLFLFDEPLSNLDAKLRAAMRIELARLHRQLGITMVYVTHDQVEAMTLGQKIILIDQGRIRQTGEPRELYIRPVDTFVASFIGSPRINLIDGRLRRQQGRTFFDCPAFSLDLGARDADTDVADQRISVGIRPEALRLGEGPIRGEIDLVEHIGAEAYVYMSVAGLPERIVANVPPDFPGRPGEKISFSADTASVHLFRDGKRVGS